MKKRFISNVNYLMMIVLAHVLRYHQIMNNIHRAIIAPCNYYPQTLMIDLL